MADKEGIGVVVLTSTRPDCREEQLQVDLTEFVGQKVSTWGSWLLFQVFLDAHNTSETSNESIDRSYSVWNGYTQGSYLFLSL